MEALIGTMANTLLDRKTKTLQETLGDLKKKKIIFYSLVYTVGITKAKPIFQTIRIVTG